MSDEIDSKQESADTAAENVEEEVDVHYEPVVKLEEVAIPTGEENDEVIYKQRCALYRFDMASSEWKERGRGDVKLLKNAQNGRVRILLRQEKTLKLCMNHFVNPLVTLQPNLGSDRSWTWRCRDYADEQAQDQTFAIRFRDSETAQQFKDKWEEMRKVNEAAQNIELWKTVLKDKKLGAISREEVEKAWEAADSDKSHSLSADQVRSLLTKIFTDALQKSSEQLQEDTRDEMKSSLDAFVSTLLDKLVKDEKVKDSQLFDNEEIKLLHH